MDILQGLIDWVAAHPHWAGALLFAISCGESLAVVGLVVPGAVLLFGVGALIGTGHLDFGDMVLWAFAGAVAGDGVSFWLGRHFGPTLRTVWPFARYPGLLDRGVAFFRNHGTASIFIGRFVGPVRPIVPAVAGMMHMPVWRFLLVNVISALLWAPAYLLPGMVFAASLAVAADVATRLVALGVIAFGAGWVLLRMSRWARARLRHAAALIASRLASRPVFAAAVGALQRRAGLFWWGALALWLATLLAVAVHPAPGRWEHAVLELLAAARTPDVRTGLWALTQVGSFAALTAATAAVAGLLWYSGYPRAAAQFAAIVGAGTGAGYGLKLLFAAPRPGDLLGAGFWYSFPSGHAFGIAVFCAAAGVLAAAPERTGRRAILLVATVLAVAVGATRLGLGVHWPLDVVAGLAFGTVVGGLAALVRAPLASSVARRAALAGFLALLVTGAGVALLRYPQGLESYPPARGGPSVFDRACPGDPPTYRPLWAESASFDWLWVGGDGSLREALRGAGWRPAPPWTLQNALRWLQPEPNPAALPSLPAWHSGVRPVLTFIRVGPDQGEDAARWVLRAWRLGATPNGAARWAIASVHERLLASWPVIFRDATARPAPGVEAALAPAGRLCFPGGVLRQP